MASYADKCENITGFKGYQPAVDNLSKKTKEHVMNDFLREYHDFFQVQLATECVDQARESFSKLEGVVVGKPSQKPFFVDDVDLGIGGAEGKSYAIVKPGKPSGGLKIVMAHTDVPCLRVSSQPVYIEADAEKCLLCPGFYLSTEKFGGIRTGDWLGMNVNIKGKVFKNDKELKINVPGIIRQISYHVDEGDEKASDSLKVFTGIRTLKELYKTFKVSDGMDFARSDLYAFPHIEKNGFVVGNEISGFGHDDRAGIFASLIAGEESFFSESDNTMILLGLDREEVGNRSSTCSYDSMIKKVLDETTDIVFAGKPKPRGGIESLLENSPVISVDTDVAFGDLELTDDLNLDFRKAPKIGWGFFLNGFDSDWDKTKTSAKQVAQFMDLIDNNLGVKNVRDRYQVLGGFVKNDAPFGTATMADIFGNHFSTLDIGVPVLGLHHPRAETLNIFDLYWLKEAIGLHLRA
ncbi:hypothetical protein H8D91_01620 [archaeon]|nr:hypothetical protein [archaeon]